MVVLLEIVIATAIDANSNTHQGYGRMYARTYVRTYVGMYVCMYAAGFAVPNDFSSTALSKAWGLGFGLSLWLPRLAESGTT